MLTDDVARTPPSTIGPAKAHSTNVKWGKVFPAHVIVTFTASACLLAPSSSKTSELPSQASGSAVLEGACWTWDRSSSKNLKRSTQHPPKDHAPRPQENYDWFLRREAYKRVLCLNIKPNNETWYYSMSTTLQLQMSGTDSYRGPPYNRSTMITRRLRSRKMKDGDAG